ncbi:hypothetical protein JYU02_00755 [bacterium AH-315-P15]|nr:hypothetical protein [bacterium AH-315-P15]
MRIWKIATAIIGAAIGTLLVFVAWLSWPLPNAEFDWQFYANEMAAEGYCTEFTEFLLDMSVTDPEDLALYLEEQSLLDRCPTEDGGKPGRAAWQAAQITDEIEDIIEYHRRFPEYVPSLETSFKSGFAFWAAGRRIRRGSVASSLAWPDLVIGFRCLRPLEFGPSSIWYSVRRGNAFAASRPNRLPAWEARYAWCRNYVLSEAAKLDGNLAKDPNFELREDFFERANRYRRLADGLRP